MLKGVILSEIDSRNGPIKLAYFVTPCSNHDLELSVILQVKVSYLAEFRIVYLYMNAIQNVVSMSVGIVVNCTSKYF